MSYREDVHAALFALGQGLTWTPPGADSAIGFATTSRRVKLWDDPDMVLPALCQGERSETNAKIRTGMPRIRTFGVDWLIYFTTTSAAGEIPAQTTNAVLDAVDDLFPDGEDQDGPFGTIPFVGQNLGGLVERVQIRGTIRKWQGDLDGSALILIPLEILAP